MICGNQLERDYISQFVKIQKNIEIKLAKEKFGQEPSYWIPREDTCDEEHETNELSIKRKSVLDECRIKLANMWKVFIFAVSNKE